MQCRGGVGARGAARAQLRAGMEVPSDPSPWGPSPLSPAEHTAQKVGFLQSLTHHKGPSGASGRGDGHLLLH